MAKATKIYRQNCNVCWHSRHSFIEKQAALFGLDRCKIEPTVPTLVNICQFFAAALAKQETPAVEKDRASRFFLLDERGLTMHVTMPANEVN